MREDFEISKNKIDRISTQLKNIRFSKFNKNFYSLKLSRKTFNFET